MGVVWEPSVNSIHPPSEKWLTEWESHLKKGRGAISESRRLSFTSHWEDGFTAFLPVQVGELASSRICLPSLKTPVRQWIIPSKLSVSIPSPFWHFADIAIKSCSMQVSVYATDIWRRDQIFTWASQHLIKTRRHGRTWRDQTAQPYDEVCTWETAHVADENLLASLHQITTSQGYGFWLNFG